MKRQATIRVTIVDDATRAKCEARCGLDLSSPEIFKSTAELLRKHFGGRVKLEYATSDAIQAGPLARIAEKVKVGELSLPLLLINGNPRVSGYFDLHLLQECVQAEMEMAASAGGHS